MTFGQARRRGRGALRPGAAERESTAPALILGGHLTGLGVLRLLAVRGVNAYAVDAQHGDMMTRSRWYRSAPGQIAETSDSGRLAEYLGSLPFERAPLLPCTDAWTRAVAGLPDDIRTRFPASVPAPATIEQFVDKDRFRTLVEALDVPRPRCVMLHADRDLAGIPETEIAAGFLKPTNSQLFASRFEGKGLWVRDRREAGRLVAAARDAGIDLMLQEWIPGDPSHNVLIDCFVDRGGRITGLLGRRKIRMYPPRLGNTSSAVTIPLADLAGPIAATRSIIEATSYRGVFSAEFKFDDRDRRFKILEVNARLFWYVAHAAAAGLDLAWMSYLDALELPVPRATSYRTGVYGLYEINDAAALKRSLRSHQRRVGPVLRPWLLGRRALFALNDPGPAFGVVRAELGRIVAGRG